MKMLLAILYQGVWLEAVKDTKIHKDKKVR